MNVDVILSSCKYKLLEFWLLLLAMVTLFMESFDDRLQY